MIHTFPLPTAPGRAGTARLVLSAEDWDALFLAVTARMRSTAQPAPTSRASASTTQYKTSADMRGVVLECVQALEQLHAALACERADATTRARATHPDIVCQPKMSA